jgi:porin
MQAVGRKQSILLLSCVLFLVWTFSPLQADAQQAPPTESEVDAQQAPPTKSGYSEAAGLEGPGGVTSELAEDDIDVGAVWRPPLLDGALQPWFDLKRKWNQKYGFQLGGNYNALYQAASETSTSLDDAAGGRFQIQGMWTLLGRKSKNPGGISFRFEDRHRLGTDIPPTQLV